MEVRAHQGEEPGKRPRLSAEMHKEVHQGSRSAETEPFSQRLKPRLQSAPALIGLDI